MFSDNLLFNSILNVLLIVNFLLIPDCIFSCLISPPTVNIMHRSVSFHRTFGDLTQTCAFLNFNVFNVLPTQEGDFCVWRASK